MDFNYLDYTCEYTVDSFPSVPAEGLTYRFAPKFKRTDDPGLLNLEVPTNPVDVVTLKVNPPFLIYISILITFAYYF